VISLVSYEITRKCMLFILRSLFLLTWVSLTHRDSKSAIIRLVFGGEGNVFIEREKIKIILE